MSNIIELPRYRCHKQVWALKIKAIIPNPRGAELHFENDRYCPFEMPAEWADKHQPQTGGYLVVYEGGYRSYSPAEAFESGYTLLGNSKATVSTVSEEDLERLYWEFDDARSKSPENERLRFKETLRGLVRSLGNEVN